MSLVDDMKQVRSDHIRLCDGNPEMLDRLVAVVEAAERLSRLRSGDCKREDISSEMEGEFEYLANQFPASVKGR